MADCETTVTPEDLSTIIISPLDDAVLQACIDAACSLVEETTGGCDYTQEKRDQLCLWLAAHFTTAISPQVTSERIGSRSVVYANVYDGGLNSSSYGQMVQNLDTCGSLSELNKDKFLLTSATEYD